ncbi:MAG: DNA cytosine methyltransferase [Betaproteobacteria bacterium]|nr:DNA cytosine methyltransferase [Betaproteobacteria bacterium]
MAGRRREDDENFVTGPFGGGDYGAGRRSEYDPNLVSGILTVRRLTPRECERLQGLPDDWTKLDAKTPDSRRYAALGDAVTVNVAEWIGRRLKEAA